MKKLLFLLVICAAVSCKKDSEKTLTEKTWAIESINVTPAMTIGKKTSTNYIDLMGPNSCAATMQISFSNDGTYLAGANGALCDMYVDASIKTWRIENDQIFLSPSPNAPLTLKNNKLTQTTTTSETGGIVYTFVYVYKAKSK